MTAVQEKAKILILEDEPGVIALYKTLLRNGYDLFIAQTVREALQYLKENPDVKAALLDYKVSDGTGTDIVRAIRYGDNPIKVAALIMCTGNHLLLDKPKNLELDPHDVDGIFQKNEVLEVVALLKLKLKAAFTGE